jgi:uncharacterized metal-binding protein
MPELPKKKVGIVSCSGEEMAEGTVTRLAALKVLEELRPGETVTICLPLFLAGGEGDRAFARFYPTIAIDGCERRCAARGTEMYSGKPAAGVVVTDFLAQRGLARPSSARRLDAAGVQAVDAVAQDVAERVDGLLSRGWSRRAGDFVEEAPPSEAQEPVQATCSCGSGIPVQEVMIAGQAVTLVALPLIFQQFREAGKVPSDGTSQELLETARVYNPVPAGQEEAYAAALALAYAAFCDGQEASA